MRMKLAVLDANHQQRNETMERIADYVRRRHLDIVYDAFSSGVELLENAICGNQYDIYILETKIPELNAFYIARELRNQYRNCRIIYYTENMSGAVSAFEINADNYLIKPASRERFDRCLDMAITNAEKAYMDNSIQIKSNIGCIRVASSDIAYVNIVNRALCYHLCDGTSIRTAMFRGRFRDVLYSMSDNPAFCFIGASLLVNLAAVEVFSRDSIIFTNGETISIPRTGYSLAYRKFLTLH